MFFTLSTTKKIFWLPTLVFVGNWVLIWVFNVYETWEWFDIPMHILGGASIAYGAYIFFSIIKKEHRIGKIEPWIQVVLSIGLVMLFAVLWEFWEYAMDYFFRVNYQPHLADTMQDLFLGLLGGSIVAQGMVTKK